MKITVLGTGGWGMALAIALHKNQHDITLWTFFEQECQMLQQKRGNQKLLPDIFLPETMPITTDMAHAVQGAELVILAVPSFVIASTAQTLASVLPAGVPVVNVGKGLDATNNYCRFSQTLEQALGNNPIVALTGPTHAEEVARGIPTAILAASTDKTAATLCQDALMSDTFRVYTSPDVVGAELGGAFKNIIALGAGIIDGLGLGDNTKAAFMTRGLTEIARLGVVLGAKQDTFAGLSGMGDLIVTCTSMHSRNRRAGILIGQGMSAKDAMEQVGAVVEGYYATEAGYQLAKQAQVSMPIVESMYAVLYEGADPKNATMLLMGRDRKHESESTWLK